MLFDTVMLILILVASVLTPLLLYRRLQKTGREENERFRQRIEQNLGAAVKLLEVRDYYQETSAALKKMLDEAYREGNRFRQDQLRKLIERLDALKARTLDRTVRILEPDGNQGSRRRRRRRRPRHMPPQGQPPQGQPPSPPAQPPAK